MIHQIENRERFYMSARILLFGAHNTGSTKIRSDGTIPNQLSGSQIGVSFDKNSEGVWVVLGQKE